MYDSTTTVTVGPDVHARSIRLAAVRADELLEERTLPYDEEAVEQVLRRWPGVRCCYEAGPTGFGLYRHLVGRGIDCSVVAPGLMPQRPGDRIKTDPRDARKLARLLAGGLLEPIHVPSRELEAARDLVRAREDARLDRMRDRHRLSKFCLRHGRVLPTSSWTVMRRKWLGEQRFEFAAQQITFDSYVHTVDLVDARIEQLERAIRETAEQEPWCGLVARLRCLRGIDTLTALALATEIGDFDRFKTAEEFMAFVGLVPSEHSSGEKRRQGSITKVGNSHVHTVDLVDRRIEALERAIRETAEQEPWRELVARLRCLRGVDTLTALALVSEIGDFSRFRSPWRRQNLERRCRSRIRSRRASSRARTRSRAASNSGDGT
jgi:transposase